MPGSSTRAVVEMYSFCSPDPRRSARFRSELLGLSEAPGATVPDKPGADQRRMLWRS